MRERSGFVAICLVAVIGALLLSACGGGGGSSKVAENLPPTTATPQTTTAAGSTTDTSSGSPFVPRATLTFSMLDKSSGDAETGTLQIGSFVPADETVTLPSGLSSQTLTCAVNPERDVIAGGVFELRNDNNGFAQDLAADLYAINGKNSIGLNGIGAPSFSVDVDYNTGPTCIQVATYGDVQDGTGAPMALSQDGVQPGNSTQVEFFIIVSGVRTPANPNENPNVLGNLGLMAAADTPAHEVQSCSNEVGQYKLCGLLFS